MITKRKIIEAYSIKSRQNASEMLKHVENLRISRATVYRHVQKLRNGINGIRHGKLRDLGHAGARSVI